MKYTTDHIVKQWIDNQGRTVVRIRCKACYRKQDFSYPAPLCTRCRTKWEENPSKADFWKQAELKRTQNDPCLIQSDEE